MAACCGTPETSCSKLYNFLVSGGFIIVLDIRPRHEYREQHIPGAVCLPPPVDDVKFADVEEALAALLFSQQHEHALKQRAGRQLILYGSESLQSADSNSWCQQLTQLFVAEALVACVSFLEGGLAQFALRFPFLPLVSHDRNDEDVCCGAQLAFPNEVFPGTLYLGNYQHALRKEVFTAMGITHVVDCSQIKDVRCRWEDLGVKYLTLDVADMEGADIQSHFKQVCKFIEEAIASTPPCSVGSDQTGGGVDGDGQSCSGNRPARVLVHCMAGVSRSAALVTAFLMYHKRWSLLQSYQHVYECREQIFINMGFRKRLLEWEKKLGLKPSVREEQLEFLGGILSVRPKCMDGPARCRYYTPQMRVKAHLAARCSIS